jgi:hypothetical protein
VRKNERICKGNVVPIGSKQFHSQWSTTVWEAVVAPPSGIAACTSAHHAPPPGLGGTQDKLLNAVDALGQPEFRVVGACGACMRGTHISKLPAYAHNSNVVIL